MENLAVGRVLGFDQFGGGAGPVPAGNLGGGRDRFAAAILNSDGHWSRQRLPFGARIDLKVAGAHLGHVKSNGQIRLPQRRFLAPGSEGEKTRGQQAQCEPSGYRADGVESNHLFGWLTCCILLYSREYGFCQRSARARRALTFVSGSSLYRTGRAMAFSSACWAWSFFPSSARA